MRVSPIRSGWKPNVDLPAAEVLARGALAVEAQDARPQARDLALELAPPGAAEVDLGDRLRTDA